MKYKIVEAPSSSDLMEKVNKLLEKGWVVKGGVSLTGINGIYCQALTKS